MVLCDWCADDFDITECYKISRCDTYEGTDEVRYMCFECAKENRLTI